jgi:hypothetical protein
MSIMRMINHKARMRLTLPLPFTHKWEPFLIDDYDKM